MFLSLFIGLLIAVKGQDDHLCACYMLYDPYCCNGKQYSNDCFAKCEGENLSECQHNEC